MRAPGTRSPRLPHLGKRRDSPLRRREPGGSFGPDTRKGRVKLGSVFWGPGSSPGDAHAGRLPPTARLPLPSPPGAAGTWAADELGTPQDPAAPGTGVSEMGPKQSNQHSKMLEQTSGAGSVEGGGSCTGSQLPGSAPRWPNGEGTGLLSQGLWVRVPPGVITHNFGITMLGWLLSAKSVVSHLSESCTF